jgi:hypothetical protein
LTCAQPDVRLHHVSIAIEGDLARVPAGEHFGLGPRADPAHLPLEDVDDLRQFVEAEISQHTPDARDPMIIVAGHRGAPLVLDADRAHRPELVDDNVLARVADALLAEEDGARTVEADGKGDDRHDRERHGQQDNREDEIDEALQMKIAAHRHERAEAVFGQLLDLGQAGQRLPQLLDLINDAAGERRVGKESLPFVRRIGGEVGNDGIASPRVLKPRTAKNHPVDRVDVLKAIDRAEGHHRNAAPDAVGREIEDVKPADVESEPER